MTDELVGFNPRVALRRQLRDNEAKLDDSVSKGDQISTAKVLEDTARKLWELEGCSNGFMDAVKLFCLHVNRLCEREESLDLEIASNLLGKVLEFTEPNMFIASNMGAALETIRIKLRATALNNLGCYAKRGGNMDNATSYLKEASRLESSLLSEGDPSPALNTAQLLVELSRIPEALPFAQSALRLSQERVVGLSQIPAVHRPTGVAHQFSTIAQTLANILESCDARMAAATSLEACTRFIARHMGVNDPGASEAFQLLSEAAARMRDLPPVPTHQQQQLMEKAAKLKAAQSDDTPEDGFIIAQCQVAQATGIRLKPLSTVSYGSPQSISLGDTVEGAGPNALTNTPPPPTQPTTTSHNFQRLLTTTISPRLDPIKGLKPTSKIAWPELISNSVLAPPIATPESNLFPYAAIDSPMSRARRKLESLRRAPQTFAESIVERRSPARLQSLSPQTLESINLHMTEMRDTIDQLRHNDSTHPLVSAWHAHVNEVASNRCAKRRTETAAELEMDRLIARPTAELLKKLSMPRLPQGRPDVVSMMYMREVDPDQDGTFRVPFARHLKVIVSVLIAHKLFDTAAKTVSNLMFIVACTRQCGLSFAIDAVKQVIDALQHQQQLEQQDDLNIPHSVIAHITDFFEFLGGIVVLVQDADETEASDISSLLFLRASGISDRDNPVRMNSELWVRHVETLLSQCATKLQRWGGVDNPPGTVRRLISLTRMRERLRMFEKRGVIKCLGFGASKEHAVLVDLLERGIAAVCAKLSVQDGASMPPALELGLLAQQARRKGKRPPSAHAVASLLVPANKDSHENVNDLISKLMESDSKAGQHATELENAGRRAREAAAAASKARQAEALREMAGTERVVVKKPAGAWAHVKLYLSSMSAFDSEREILNVQILPALRQRAASSLRVDFSWIDFMSDGGAEAAIDLNQSEIEDTLNLCKVGPRTMLLSLLSDKGGKGVCRVSQELQSGYFNSPRYSESWFMLRNSTFTCDPRFVEEVPSDVAAEFTTWPTVEDQQIGERLLERLGSTVHAKSRLHHYDVSYLRCGGSQRAASDVRLGNLDNFGMQVYALLWEAISAYYPPSEEQVRPHDIDVHKQTKLSNFHNTNFLTSMPLLSSPRFDTVRHMKEYPTGPDGCGGVSMLIGESGSGRSAIMARVKQDMDIAVEMWSQMLALQKEQDARIKETKNVFEKSHSGEEAGSLANQNEGFTPRDAALVFSDIPLLQELAERVVRESPCHFQRLPSGRYKAIEALRVRPVKILSFLAMPWQTLHDACLFLCRELRQQPRLNAKDGDAVALFKHLLKEEQEAGVRVLVILDGFGADVTEEMAAMFVDPIFSYSLTLMITATKVPEALKDYERLKRLVVVPIPPLTKIEREGMVAAILKKRNRVFTPEEIVLLISKQSADLPAYLTFALNELCRASLRPGQFHCELVQMHNGFGGLIEGMISRLEAEFGTEVVRMAMELVYRSDKGLNQSELRMLLKSSTSSSQTLACSQDVRIYPVTNAMLLALAPSVERDAGLLAFGNETMRNVVASHYSIDYFDDMVPIYHEFSPFELERVFHDQAQPNGADVRKVGLGTNPPFEVELLPEMHRVVVTQLMEDWGVMVMFPPSIPIWMRRGFQLEGMNNVASELEKGTRILLNDGGEALVVGTGAQQIDGWLQSCCYVIRQEVLQETDKDDLADGFGRRAIAVVKDDIAEIVIPALKPGDRVRVRLAQESSSAKDMPSLEEDGMWGSELDLLWEDLAMQNARECVEGVVRRVDWHYAQRTQKAYLIHCESLDDKLVGGIGDRDKASGLWVAPFDVVKLIDCNRGCIIPSSEMQYVGEAIMFRGNDILVAKPSGYNFSPPETSDPRMHLAGQHVRLAWWDNTISKYIVSASNRSKVAAATNERLDKGLTIVSVALYLEGGSSMWRLVNIDALGSLAVARKAIRAGAPQLPETFQFVKPGGHLIDLRAEAGIQTRTIFPPIRRRLVPGSALSALGSISAGDSFSWLDCPRSRYGSFARCIVVGPQGLVSGVQESALMHVFENRALLRRLSIDGIDRGYDAITSVDVDVSKALAEGTNASNPNQSGQTWLHRAASSDENVSAITLLASSMTREEQFVTMSCANNSGRTPLHLAAEFGLHRACQAMLRWFHCDPNMKDVYHGLTALQMAKLSAAGRQLESRQRLIVREFLLDDRVDIHEHWDIFSEALREAAYAGKRNELNYLLQRRDGTAVINDQGMLGRTALHEACEMGKVDCVSLLLQSGASAMLLDWRGQTPLHYAARNRHREVVILLCENEPAAAGCQDTCGRLPLHEWKFGVSGRSYMERWEIQLETDSLSRLIETTNNVLPGPTQTDEALILLQDYNGIMPIHNAARFAKQGPLEQMLTVNHGSIDALTTDGWSPLGIAIFCGKIHEAKFLIERGASVKSVAPGNRGALVMLCQCWRRDALIFLDNLVQASQSQERRQALVWVAREGKSEILKHLLNSGVDPDSEVNGISALYYAARNGNSNDVEELMNAGAQQDLEHMERYSPIHVAVASGHYAVVCILCRATGSVDWVASYPTYDEDDEVGRKLCVWGRGLAATPLHRAAGVGDVKIMRYLVNFRNADVEARVEDGGVLPATPLTVAFLSPSGPKHEAVRFLIEEKDVRANPRDVMEALRGEDPGIAQLTFESLKVALLPRLVQLRAPIRLTTIGSDRENALSGPGVVILAGSWDSEKQKVGSKLSATTGPRTRGSIVSLQRAPTIVGKGDGSNRRKEQCRRALLAISEGPLHHACRLGLRDVIETLLTETEMNPQGSVGERVPQWSGDAQHNRKFAKILENEKGVPAHHARVWLSSKPLEPLWWAVRRRNLGATAAMMRAGALGDGIGFCQTMQTPVATIRQLMLLCKYGSLPCNGIHVLAVNDDAEAIKGLASVGVPIEGVDAHSATPLSAAAGAGAISACKMLIELGANCNRGFAGKMPLHEAAANGHVAVVKLLLEAKANINELVPMEPEKAPNHVQTTGTDEVDDSNPVVTDFMARVRRLLVSMKDQNKTVGGARISLESIAEQSRLAIHCSAAHLAASGKHWDVIRVLLLNGHELTIGWKSAYDSGTVLQSVLANTPQSLWLKKHDVLRGLLNKLVQLSKGVSEQIDSTGCNIVIAAARANCTSVFQNLVTMRLPLRLNVLSELTSGKNSVHYAASYGKGGLISTLLHHYSVPAKSRDRRGRLPLHYAAERNTHRDSLSLLVKNTHDLCEVRDMPVRMSMIPIGSKGQGSDVNAKIIVTYPGGNTPLHLAAASGNLICAQMLVLDAGVNVNAKNNASWTPLMLACKSRRLELAKLLIRCGANLETTAKGHDAVTAAVLGGSAAILKLLLDSFRSASISPPTGNSALLLAAQLGRDNLLKLLLGTGWSTSQTDLDHMTPLEWGLALGHLNFVRTMVKIRGMDMLHARVPRLCPALMSSEEIAERNAKRLEVRVVRRWYNLFLGIAHGIRTTSSASAHGRSQRQRTTRKLRSAVTINYDGQSEISKRKMREHMVMGFHNGISIEPATSIVRLQQTRRLTRSVSEKQLRQMASSRDVDLVELLKPIPHLSPFAQPFSREAQLIAAKAAKNSLPKSSISKVKSNFMQRQRESHRFVRRQQDAKARIQNLRAALQLRVATNKKSLPSSRHSTPAPPSRKLSVAAIPSLSLPPATQEKEKEDILQHQLVDWQTKDNGTLEDDVGPHTISDTLEDDVGPHTISDTHDTTVSSSDTQITPALVTSPTRTSVPPKPRDIASGLRRTLVRQASASLPAITPAAFIQHGVGSAQEREQGASGMTALKRQMLKMNAAVRIRSLARGSTQQELELNANLVVETPMAHVQPLLRTQVHRLRRQRSLFQLHRQSSGIKSTTTKASPQQSQSLLRKSDSLAAELLSRALKKTAPKDKIITDDMPSSPVHPAEENVIIQRVRKLQNKLERQHERKSNSMSPSLPKLTKSESLANLPSLGSLSLLDAAERQRALQKGKLENPRMVAELGSVQEAGEEHEKVSRMERQRPGGLAISINDGDNTNNSSPRSASPGPHSRSPAPSPLMRRGSGMFARSPRVMQSLQHNSPQHTPRDDQSKTSPSDYGPPSRKPSISPRVQPVHLDLETTDLDVVNSSESDKTHGRMILPAQSLFVLRSTARNDTVLRSNQRVALNALLNSNSEQEFAGNGDNWDTQAATLLLEHDVLPGLIRMVLPPSPHEIRELASGVMSRVLHASPSTVSDLIESIIRIDDVIDWTTTQFLQHAGSILKRLRTAMTNRGEHGCREWSLSYKSTVLVRRIVLMPGQKSTATISLGNWNALRLAVDDSTIMDNATGVILRITGGTDRVDALGNTVWQSIGETCEVTVFRGDEIPLADVTGNILQIELIDSTTCALIASAATVAMPVFGWFRTLMTDGNQTKTNIQVASTETQRKFINDLNSQQEHLSVVTEREMVTASLDRWSLLCRASQNGDISLVLNALGINEGRLKSAEASKDSWNVLALPALDWSSVTVAATEGSKDVVLSLIKAGETATCLPWEWATFPQRSALRACVLAGKFDIIPLLLEHGAVPAEISRLVKDDIRPEEWLMQLAWEHGHWSLGAQVALLALGKDKQTKTTPKRDNRTTNSSHWAGVSAAVHISSQLRPRSKPGTPTEAPFRDRGLSQSQHQLALSSTTMKYLVAFGHLRHLDFLASLGIELPSATVQGLLTTWREKRAEAHTALTASATGRTYSGGVGGVAAAMMASRRMQTLGHETSTHTWISPEHKGGDYPETETMACTTWAERLSIIQPDMIIELEPSEPVTISEAETQRRARLAEQVKELRLRKEQLRKENIVRGEVTQVMAEVVAHAFADFTEIANSANLEKSLQNRREQLAKEIHEAAEREKRYRIQIEEQQKVEKIKEERARVAKEQEQRALRMIRQAARDEIRANRMMAAAIQRQGSGALNSPSSLQRLASRSQLLSSPGSFKLETTSDKSSQASQLASLSQLLNAKTSGSSPSSRPLSGGSGGSKGSPTASSLSSRQSRGKNTDSMSHNLTQSLPKSLTSSLTNSGKKGAQKPKMKRTGGGFWAPAKD